MVSALVSGWSGLGSRPGQGHYVVFLGKTLDSHSASLHPNLVPKAFSLAWGRGGEKAFE